MSVYKGTAPCFDCAERKAECHSNCDKYKEWKSTGIEPEKEPFYQAKRFARRSNSVQKKPK